MNLTPFLNPTYIISILIAISVHEWAHAYTAHRFGDPTPDQNGRLTLNPIAHIDPLGALMFLVIGFGWAKPVPVSPRYFRHPKREMSLVALAGPFSNFILAIIAFFALFFLTRGTDFSSSTLLTHSTGMTALAVLVQILESSLFVNLALMAFNLLPIAPLDGSKIIQVFIPYTMEEQYEQFMSYGMYILIGLILLGDLTSFSILSWWVYGIVDSVLWVFRLVTGWF